MYRLVFGLVWTTITLLLALFATEGAEPIERKLLYFFPVFGCVFTVLSWLHWRRRASLRTEIVSGVTVYVWTGFSGREVRSETDPRPDWDDDGRGD